jgi:hypothetical protein
MSTARAIAANVINGALGNQRDLRPFICKIRETDEPWASLAKPRGYLLSASLQCEEMMEIGKMGVSLLQTRACVGQGGCFQAP